MQRLVPLLLLAATSCEGVAVLRGGYLLDQTTLAPQSAEDVNSVNASWVAKARDFEQGLHLYDQILDGEISNANEQDWELAKSKGDLPRVIVLTVPSRPDRLARLASRLRHENLTFVDIPGPSADKYCPLGPARGDADIFRGAGLDLFRREWHGWKPDLASFNLGLYQAACLTAHLRGWQRVVESQEPTVILEDDANVVSAEVLWLAIDEAKKQGSDISFLEDRHCMSGPHQGSTGYWLTPKAAAVLLKNYLVNLPVDFGLQSVATKMLKATCPSGIFGFPVREWGGYDLARQDSTSGKICKPTLPARFLQRLRQTREHGAVDVLSGERVQQAKR